MPMRVHFIAIGGSAMHNLAIALHKKRYTVTGSDDEIFEPSKTRLKGLGLLPEREGWFPEKISKDIDAVILGMHARADNPELLRAKELGLKIFSYPEYIYEQSRNKRRVVIGGSHGKTTITSIILHVLKFHDMDFDYMVGAQLEGFDTMVKITDAPVIVLEGDEYLSSPMDRRPKFHLYHPHVALLSGIAWDHINVFPTFENYVEQFRTFIGLIEKDGILIYCSNDPNAKKLAESAPGSIKKLPYAVPLHKIENGTTILTPNSRLRIPICIFGEHNLMNIEGARLVCNELGVSEEKFYSAVSSFRGASKRLELVAKNGSAAFYKDFAHSPSKLKATIAAVRSQFPERKLVACMELHTFSSLSENFLKEYQGTMRDADEAIVYFNPHTIEHKKLKPVTPEQVAGSFGGKNIKVYTDSKKIAEDLKSMDWTNKNLLVMSSGNFDGLDLGAFAKEIIE